MSVRKLIVAVVLVAGGFGVGVGLRAQSPSAPLPAQAFSVPRPVPPTVIAGPDVGFRVEGVDNHDQTVVGQIVVKVDGKWVDARVGSIASTVRPLK
jgi:hypothetical protein